MVALLCLSVPVELAAQPAPPPSAPAAQMAPTPPAPTVQPAPSSPPAVPDRPNDARRRTDTGQRGSPTSLPTVRVDARRTRRVVRARPRRPVRAVVTEAVPAAAPGPAEGASGGAGAPGTPTGSGGVIGYLATRTSTATKTDTPLVNVPQSVSVLTQQFIRDVNNQAFTETLRYVPGVIPHQGEFNRDQVVIRGQSSSADFFVNGMRDDVQYFRDVYNLERVEVLKGPNAMIFGRGGGGGIINRVLKDADGVPVRELTVQGGEFNDKRVGLDIGQAINPGVAGRFNAVFEDSASYRNFVNIQRYGINPTFTFRPNDQTKVTLSYEYFHDDRTTDRGVPSQLGTGNPLRPYNTDPSTFFGNPDLNHARVDANIGTAVIEHEFDSGLKIKNSSRVAIYDKFYQNIFPGGAVNAAGTTVNLSAYNNQTDRQNLFNQTDLTYKFNTGFVKHTLLAGVEVGQQTGLSFRQTGLFNGVSTTLAVSPLNPVTYVPVTFTNLATDANNTYRLGLAATYVQDQIEVTKHLQFVVGARFDHFSLDTTDRRSGVTLSREDNLVSPRAAIILKPLENVSFYGSYSVSYLPSSGDQFSTLNPTTAIAVPEKFTNKEIGIKWDISPRLTFQTAVYDLDRTNTRFNDPNNPALFQTGASKARGFEAGLTGYITDAWQVSGGYAYTDARVTSNTSPTIVAGNRVGLVPYNTFTLWNRYQFHPLFAAGVGIIHQGSSFAASDDTVLLPSFTRVDAAIYGRINENLRWQINVENLFSTRYYSMADGNNNITPGSPRAIRGSIRATF